MAKTRYWVKLDSKGKPVLGVLEARPKKPVGGEWLEINARPCCSVTTPIGTVDGNTATEIVLSCGEDVLFTYLSSNTDPDDVVSDFNGDNPAAGELSHDDTNFILKSAICPNLSFAVTYTT